MTVLPDLHAASELRERYQGGKFVDGGLRWSRVTSLGGAEAGRGGRGGEADPSVWREDLRLREGGESRAGFILGVLGGVMHGVVGVAGWSTIAGLEETSRGVGWYFLERLLGELARSSALAMVKEQGRDGRCQEY